MKLTDEDIEILNLNDINERGGFGADGRKPFTLHIWKDTTEEEAEQLKKQILEWQEFYEEYGHPDWQQIRKSELKELKKQILENQEIVQKVRENINEKRMMPRSVGRLINELREILGEKDG
jgi:hypothetical protein